MTSEKAIEILTFHLEQIKDCKKRREEIGFKHNGELEDDIEAFQTAIEAIKCQDIIRCKDCIYWVKGAETCCCMVVKADDFCSKAKRKEE